MDITNFKLGAIESDIDLRDYDYSMLTCVSNPINIPNSFCLDYNYPILNQGIIGSCVAHSLSEMKSYIDSTDLNNMYSVGFIYANRSNDDTQNHGMITRQALKHLVNEGCCSYKTFPINEEYPEIVSTLNNYGKEKLYTEANSHKSSAYLKINTNEIKEYLFTQQKPILIVCKVYDNFYNSLTNGGIIPKISSGNYKGSHAMICIGFNKNQLIIINSWGETYGDKGRFYLDINSTIISECWVLEDVKNINKPKTKNYTIGWNKDVNTGKWIYSEDGINLLKNTWRQIKNIWYYFKDIYALDGEWILYMNKWYWLKKDSCAMAKSEWVWVNDKCYYFYSDGSMACNTITPDGYKVDETGAWIK